MAYLNTFHCVGYWYPPEEKGVSRPSRVTKTHISFCDISDPDHFIINVPLCGSRVREVLPFYGLIQARHTLVGIGLDEEVTCSKCKKKLQWAKLKDVVEIIENEH